MKVFPKGLTHGFGPNMAIFQTFVLGNFYDILERKTAFLGNKNKKFPKSKNWHFYKGVSKPMVLVQIWPFFQPFFLGNIG